MANISSGNVVRVFTYPKDSEVAYLYPSETVEAVIHYQGTR